MQLGGQIEAHVGYQMTRRAEIGDEEKELRRKTVGGRGSLYTPFTQVL